MPGDANADKGINTLDTVLVANQIIGHSTTVSGGNPDCNQNSNQPELHDTACIARKYNSGNLEYFIYDANGNMIAKVIGPTTVRSIQYSPYNKPISISENGKVFTFNYGPDRDRYQQTVTKSGNTETLHYIGKLFERVQLGTGDIRYKKFTKTISTPATA